jgi:DUF1009 family protein
VEDRIGLIAGSGRLPELFVQGAQRQGLAVFAIGHRGETDPALAQQVRSLDWVRVGQLAKVANLLRRRGVRRAVMAGGISRVRTFTEARPDWGCFTVLAKLRSFRDDALLRGIADYLGSRGIEVVAPTPFLEGQLVPEGLLAGPALHPAQERDLALGFDVARRLGEVDVGQTVVVKNGLVMALEAVEGTDAAIRRGGTLGGVGVLVCKRAKPGQDERFDLPAIGLKTLEVMREVGAQFLAVQADKTLLLDIEALVRAANHWNISVVGYREAD